MTWHALLYDVIVFASHFAKHEIIPISVWIRKLGKKLMWLMTVKEQVALTYLPASNTQKEICNRELRELDT